MLSLLHLSHIVFSESHKVFPLLVLLLLYISHKKFFIEGFLIKYYVKEI